MKSYNCFAILIAFVGIVLIQCQSKIDEGVSIGTPSLLIDNKEILPFEEFVSIIEFIPLIAPKDTLINLSCSVYDLVIKDKIYYASRCSKDFSIHSFDLSGNHLRSWNKKGSGPGEYPAIHDIIVENSTLFINTGRGNLLKYSLPAFEYLGEIKLVDNNFVPTVSKNGEDSWLISSEKIGNGQEKIFQILNTKTNEVKALPILSLPYSGELNPGLIADSEMGKLLNFGLSDTIYHFQEDTVTSYLSLNFGSKGIAAEDYELEGHTFMEKILLSQNYAFNSGLIDYSDGVLKLMIYGLEKSYNFDQGDLSTFPFYDVFIQRDTGKKKITKSLTDVRNSSYSKEGYFYQVMQYEDWQKAINISYFGKHEEQLLQCIENLTDEEDPIILKYKVTF
ncbi:6-bladed beta-propeller [Cyclobacterium marinum]|uniref:6-bladed beta-propeller n=1 Tax=Cyclobacterium marinum TaxID=104 RepID=UPI0011ECCB58|nr:6-bladed beta-propeller [Cyclobacterium marinum]MBI0398516.1 6-bladed beta-propeller [Cyclobacterium marinum]